MVEKAQLFIAYFCPIMNQKAQNNARSAIFGATALFLNHIENLFFQFSPMCASIRITIPILVTQCISTYALV